MTPQEFDALMERDHWSPATRERYANFVPTCDATTFYREMARPDGILEVKMRDTGETRRVSWTRFFRRRAA
jgi:hypothetical protein